MTIEITPNVVSLEEIQNLLETVNPKKTAQPMKYFDGVDQKFGVFKVRCDNNSIVLKILDRLKIPNERVDNVNLLYYPNGSYNAPHADNSMMVDGKIVRVKPWTKTTVVFLNDNFIGGELVYPKQDKTIKPVPGTAVTASADFDYIHHVNKVTEGERFSLTIRII